MNKILAFVVSLFQKKYYTGVAKDTRSDEEKAKDYAHEERSVGATATQIWFDKPTTSDHFFENQNGTSSCVPHGVTLATEIFLKKVRGWSVRLSKMFLYRQRSNYPAMGMSPWQCFELVRKTGSCLYETLPTPLTETEANNIVITDQQRTEAAILEDLEYYTFTTDKNNIDALATVAATDTTGIAITIFASIREWQQEYPPVMDNVTISTAQVCHEICILNKGGFIENGVKYLAVQDSAWFGGRQIRYLSEQFIKARVYDARYWTKITMQGGIGVKPKHKFTTTLSLGMRNEEVRWLQKCLVYEGLLPTDCITGYFAGRTLAAVRVFQEKYAEDILFPNQLTAPTGFAGPSTMGKLNQLYS